MDSVKFAQRCAQWGCLFAICWAASFIFHKFNVVNIDQVEQILRSPGRFMSTYQVYHGFQFLVVILHMPIFVILRNHLRKQEDSMSSLALYSGLFYVILLVLVTVTQFHIVPRLATGYLWVLKNVFPLPIPWQFIMVFEDQVGSIPFAFAMVGHFFYAGSMIIFGRLLFAREKKLAWAMWASAAAPLVTYLVLSRGFAMGDFGYFGMALLQAVVLYLLAKKFREIMLRRTSI